MLSKNRTSNDGNGKKPNSKAIEEEEDEEEVEVEEEKQNSELLKQNSKRKLEPPLNRNSKRRKIDKSALELKDLGIKNNSESLKMEEIKRSRSHEEGEGSPKKRIKIFGKLVSVKTTLDEINKDCLSEMMVIRDCYKDIYKEIIYTIYRCRKVKIKKESYHLLDKTNDIIQIVKSNNYIISEDVKNRIKDKTNEIIREVGCNKIINAVEMTSIYNREEMKDEITKEIKEIIDIINPEYDFFYPQVCFLIYGNRRIGKTSLWYYLECKFKSEEAFNNYDIILFTAGGNTFHRQCYVRLANSETGNKFYESNDIPLKRDDHPRIIISDNKSIREDEFSEDDIIIMISSPDADIYKVFRNKRAPIQFYIPPFKEDELIKVLAFHNIKWNDDNLNNSLKDQIIYRQSRRLRFYTYNMTDKFIEDTMGKKIENKYRNSFFIEDGKVEINNKNISKNDVGIVPKQINKIRKNDIQLEMNLTLDQALKFLKQNPFPLRNKNSNITPDVSNITPDIISKVLPNFSREQLLELITLLVKQGESQEVNSLCKIFGEVPPILKEDKTIRINCEVFQYPRKVVYIRDSYEELWDFLQIIIMMNYMKTLKNGSSLKQHLGILIENIERITKEKVVVEDIMNDFLNVCVKIINKWKDRDYSLIPECFLLRGNPGLGKTSFIIYFLSKLHMFRDTLKSLGKEKLKIVVFKSNNNTSDKEKNQIIPIMYELKENGTLEVTQDETSVDIVISDSYNYNLTSCSYLLVLYISSPDTRSYESFYSRTVEKTLKDCLYLDVFSENEINEWIDKCLPPDLGEYIRENEVAERYGNVPRHIYFDSIYNKYFGRNYWGEIYSKSIDIFIGGNGFIDFVKDYIIPCKSSDDKISTLQRFDIT